MQIWTTRLGLLAAAHLVAAAGCSDDSSAVFSEGGGGSTPSGVGTGDPTSSTGTSQGGSGQTSTGQGGTGQGGTGQGGGADVCTGCGPGELCDATLGCVDCLGPADCAEQGGQPICFFGSCEECGTDADCLPGEYCDPGDKVCRDDCQGNGDCDNGDANICVVETGACVECVAPTDCQDNPLCNTDLGICADCITDADCGLEYCQVDRGRCRECLIDPHCAPGEHCIDRECVAGCLTNDDCFGDTPVCDTAESVCVECLDDTTCLDQGNPHCGAANTCEECTESAHCVGDPDQPFCSPQEECVECLTDVDCPNLDCNDFECGG